MSDYTKRIETCRGKLKLTTLNALASANIPAVEVEVHREKGRVVTWDCPVSRNQADCGAYEIANLVDHQNNPIVVGICRCRFVTEAE